MAKKHEATFKEYIRFRAIPKPFRAEEYGFNTDGEFSKEFKVSEQTLSTWKKDDEFINGKEKYLKDWGKDKTPNVIASLYKRILQEGKSSEAKLWFKYINDWREGIELDTTIKHKENKIDKLLENADEKTKRQLEQAFIKIIGEPGDKE